MFVMKLREFRKILLKSMTQINEIKKKKIKVYTWIKLNVLKQFIKLWNCFTTNVPISLAVFCLEGFWCMSVLHNVLHLLSFQQVVITVETFGYDWHIVKRGFHHFDFGGSLPTFVMICNRTKLFLASLGKILLGLFSLYKKNLTRNQKQKLDKTKQNKTNTRQNF